MSTLQILQTLNIANVFVDPKTIVDKPTSKPPQTVISDFAPLNGTNTTEAQVVTFLDNDFAGEGQELESVSLPGFIPNPTFLNNITDPLAKAFAGAVHGFWPSLTRSTDKSKECDGKKCESTLIPLNHTFVVPGELYMLSCPCVVVPLY
jgi:alpha,alpha-trehalase